MCTSKRLRERQRVREKEREKEREEEKEKERERGRERYRNKKTEKVNSVNNQRTEGNPTELFLLVNFYLSIFFC